MATENRPSDDLQEAVAATLRRLRGEVRNQAPVTAVARTEPQFPSAIEDHARPAAAGEDSLVEPDLLTRSDPEIPPTPAARAVMRESLIAYQEGTTRGRLRWLPYALSLAAIVVFAGIVWWAYHAIVAAPKNGQVPVIAADQTPAKVPPADQGTTDGSGQEKTVYSQISGANTQPKTEVLLPAPESPQAPPPPAAPPIASEAAPAPSTTDAEIIPLPTPAAPATTGAAAGETTTQQTTTADTGAPTAGETTTADAGSSTAGATTSPDIDLSGVPTLAPILSVPETTTADNAGTAAGATTGAPNATSETAAIADNFHIQLAALKSEAEANKAWNRILAKHNDVLGALTVHIVRADLGSQGIYYRVQAGPFADKASATGACDQLKSAGQQCLVKP